MRLQNSWRVRTSAAAACHGMMLMPRPWRTIALMISTFSVSMMISGSIPSRVKKASTSRRVIDPVSKSTKCCLSRSPAAIDVFFASGWVG